MSLVAPIEGWAAVYDEADLNGDVVARGAFAQSLARTGAGAVKMLYQHAVDRIVGRWLRFEDRPQGLYAFGEILLIAERQNEAYALAKAGVLDGLSIGYQTRRAEKPARRGDAARRRIVEADLWEVSLVTFPMAPKARLTRVGAPRDVFIDPETEAFAKAIRNAASIFSNLNPSV